MKVLPGEMAGQVSVERFKREIALAARLQHPHIVPLLTAGEANGLPYFTMPLVKGESLRVRLAQRGELPLHSASARRAGEEVSREARRRSTADGDGSRARVFVVQGDAWALRA